jgi:3-deoxy-D-manno-octulosonic-acid transferase
VTFGPHTENFAILAESLAAQGGALKVNTASEIQEAIIGLLRDETLRERLLNNARRVT